MNGIRHGLALVLTLASLAAAGCQLKRPVVVPARMIEPRFIQTAPDVRVQPTGANADATAPVRLRLLETQARAHIGRRLLHRLPAGEFTEDSVWSWTSSPARYLDSSLRLALSSSRRLQPVDRSDAVTMAVTLTEWHVDTTNGSALVAASEILVTGTDRVVRTFTIRRTEPVSKELPGNLSDAAGRLLQALAADSLEQTMQVM